MLKKFTALLYQGNLDFSRTVVLFATLPIAVLVAGDTGGC